jgi:hypothetical protein
MASTEAVDLLKSIDRSLKLLLQQQAGWAKGAQDTDVADDSDLDSKYGDPEVRAKDPRDRGGAPMKGLKFSECPAEYLELLADRFDYFAGKEPDAKKANYNRKDAARARGWAARKRAGWVNTATGEITEPAGDGFADSEWPAESVTDAEIPF